MSEKKIHLALTTPEMSREEAGQRLIAALRRSGLEIKAIKRCRSLASKDL